VPISMHQAQVIPNTVNIDSDDENDEELSEIEQQIKRKKQKEKSQITLRESVECDTKDDKRSESGTRTQSSTSDTPTATAKIPETREEKLAKLRGRSFFRSSFRTSPMSQFAYTMPNNSEVSYATPFHGQFQRNSPISQQQQAAAFMFQNYMSQMSGFIASQGPKGAPANNAPGAQQQTRSTSLHSLPTSDQHQEMMRVLSQQMPPGFGAPHGAVLQPSTNVPHDRIRPATASTPKTTQQTVPTSTLKRAEKAKFSPPQQDEIHNKVKVGAAAMKRAWNHLLNTKKSVLIRIDELSDYLFRDCEPTSLEATLRLLDEHKTFFKQVSSGEFECHSVREVERIDKEQQQHINEQFQQSFTLAKVASILFERNQSPSKQESRKRYRTVLNTQVKRLKELKPEQSKDKDTKHYLQLVKKENSFTLEDHQILRDLKNYALGMSTSSLDGTQNGIQKVHQLIMDPLGVSKDTSSAFELCRQLNLFESENIPLLRALHLQPDHFKLQFPKKVLREAQAIKAQMLKLPDPDAKTRRDFRSLSAFAIDDEGTLEVDDAISVKQLDDGRVELYVHIADATKFISPKDNMNESAMDRVSSIYLPDKHIPMLPCDLSVDVLSLSEEHENDVLTFIATINTEGTVEDCQVVPSKISRVHRWTYDHFDDQLKKATSHCDQQDQRSTNSTDDQLIQLKSLLQVANVRLKHRLMKGAQKVSQKGASDMSSTVTFDTQSNDIQLRPKIHTRHSRRIVEEFMIVANEVSAKFAAQNNITIPFRGTHGSQNEPSPHTEEEINKIINTKPIFSAEDLIARMKETGFRVDQASQDKRSTGAAMFSSPRPHHALGVSAYTFATSPLRRYIDLLVHHQLKCWIRGNEPLTWEEIQNQLSRVEPKQRQIFSLQRESAQFWTLKYFERKQGEDFDGIICGIDSVLSDSLADRAMLVDVLLPHQGYHTKIRVQRDVEVGEKIKIRCVHCKASTSSVRFVEV